jgi:Flp pilus assembly protein protease CpaA
LNLDVLAPALPFAAPALAAGLLLVAVARELHSGEIPNPLVLAGVLSGLGLGLVDGDLAQHGVGLFLALGIGVWLYRRGAAGGGLVKLFGGVGALLGGLVAVLTAVFAALAWGAIYLAETRGPLKRVDDGRGSAVPGSPVLAFGALLAWLLVTFVLDRP